MDEKELEAVAGGKVSVCVTPGNDPRDRNGKDGIRRDDPFLPPCTAYGNNPHPDFGITFKIC
jgi:hypothetical protein